MGFLGTFVPNFPLCYYNKEIFTYDKVMHSFSDPYGFELEKSLLGRLDFPVYLALVCLLIHKLCHEDYNNINLRYL